MNTISKSSPCLRAALAACALFVLAGCNPFSAIAKALEPDWLTEIREVHLAKNPVVQEQLGKFSRVGTSMSMKSGEKVKNADGVIIDIAPARTEVTLKLQGKKANGEVHFVLRDPEWADEQMMVPKMTLTVEGGAPIDLAPPTLSDAEPMFKDALRQGQLQVNAEMAALAELDSEVTERLGTPLVAGDRLDKSFHLRGHDREYRDGVRLKVRGPKGKGIVRATVVTPAGEGAKPHIEGLAFESTL